MKPIRNYAKGPEAKIQEEIINFLKLRDWFVRVIHGNTFQSGLPDLWAAHRQYGQRWIEVKNPKKYAFTGAQLETFPRMIAAGVNVYVLVEASEDEYKKLFGPSNYWTYLNAI